MSSPTMKAITYEAFGSPDNLTIREIPRPVAADDEVLVRVVATAVNPVDWKILAGYLQQLPLLAQPEPSAEKPNQLGFDVAGIVTAVGANVQDFKVGDQVYSDVPKTASFAEYVTIPAVAVAKKPTNVSFDQAAGIPLVSLTSYQSLHMHGKLKKGDNVLILGGSTATGIYGIQFAKAAGCTVTTTASAAKEQFLKSLGADRFIDYKSQRFEEVLKDEPKFDVIYDIGGVADTLDKSLSVLKPDGRFVTIVGERIGDITKYKENPSLDEHNRFKEFILTQNRGQDLREIAQLFEQGKVVSAEEKIYGSLEDIPTALKQSISGAIKGKIIVRVGSE